MAWNTITVTPGGYISPLTNMTISNPERAYDAASSSTYAYCYASGPSVNAHIDFTISGITVPSGATHISVTCSAKYYTVNDSGYTTDIGLQMFSGENAKGTADVLTNAARKHTYTRTIADCGTWTGAEVQDMRLRFSYRTTSSANNSNRRTMYFYGATITITWYEPDMHVKVGGTWKKAVAVYSKVGGEWKESIVHDKVGGAWKES